MLFCDDAEQIIWMDYPSPERVDHLAGELQRKHAEHFMVWNVAGAGAAYDAGAFGGRVVQLRFGGYLCPPLRMLVEACASIDAWLRADAANVVAVHCRTGRGRSAVLLCCLLAWRAARGARHSPLDCLSVLAQLRGEDENVLTLPSHRRYLHYFGAVLGGSRPAGRPLELRSLMLNGMPPLGAPPSVQLSCGAKTVYASGGADVTTLPPAAGQPADAATTYAVAPSGAALPLVSEDVVLSVREPAADDGAPGALIFRAAFHTDFVPGGGVLRLNRAALDGASKKLHPDAFVDVIIAPPDGDKGGGGAANGAAALWRAVDALVAEGAAADGAGGLRAGARRPKPTFALGDEDEDGEDGDGGDAPRAPTPSFPAPPPFRGGKAATPPPAAPPAAAAAAGAAAAAASADADAPAANGASAAPAQAPEPGAEPPDLDAEIALVLAEGRIDGGVVGGGGVPLLDDELRELDEEFESLLDGE